MGTAYMQMASLPTNGQEPTGYNAGTTDIPAHTVVVIDTGNLIDNSTTANKNMFSVTLPAATAGLVAVFVTREIIPAKKTGRLFGAGEIALVTCQGAVTANTFVGTSGSVAGAVATYTATSPYLGVALTTGADTDEIPVYLLPGVTA